MARLPGSPAVTLASGLDDHHPLHRAFHVAGAALPELLQTRAHELGDAPFLRSVSVEWSYGERWLHTGDVGYRDDDGFFFLVDRKKDMIIRGGENIYPREIEDVLLEHPAVQGAAVIGRPDEVRGEEVHAVVVLAPGSELARIEEHCRGLLAAFNVAGG